MECGGKRSATPLWLERLVLRWTLHKHKPKRRRASLAAALHKVPERDRQFTPHTPLLPNTKLAENHIQQIFGGGLADDFPDGIDGDAKIHGGEFKRHPATQRFDSAEHRNAAPLKRVLMARVDHDFQHLGFDLA